MSQIKRHYNLISENDLKTLNTIVENHINSGWELYGSPSAVKIKRVGEEIIYMQAVIRVEQIPSNVPGNISIR